MVSTLMCVQGGWPMEEQVRRLTDQTHFNEFPIPPRAIPKVVRSMYVLEVWLLPHGALSHSMRNLRTSYVCVLLCTTIVQSLPK